MTMSLLERLKMGRAAVALVTINNTVLGLRLLTDRDYQIAGLAADAMLLAHNTELTISNSEVYEAEKSLQLLFLALVDPAGNKPLFANTDQCRATLTRDDKTVLITAYMAHERQFAPAPSNMSEVDYAALLEEVKKNPLTMPLNDLSSDTLKRLVQSLASLLQTSAPDNGSTF